MNATIAERDKEIKRLQWELDSWKAAYSDPAIRPRDGNGRFAKIVTTEPSKYSIDKPYEIQAPNGNENKH